MSAIAVTPLYAAALAVIVVALLLRVVLLRWRYRVGIGTGEQQVLGRAVRAHGNATETVPLALVLLLLAELGGATPPMLHAAGATLVVARLVHAYGLSRHAGVSWGRTAGTVLTVCVMLYLAGVLVGLAV